MRQYWLGIVLTADWKVGGAWQLAFPDGRVADTGEIIEFEPGKRLATVTHSMEREDSKFIDAGAARYCLSALLRQPRSAQSSRGLVHSRTTVGGMSA